MFTDQWGGRWYESKDLHVGMKIPHGSPYAGAIITRIKNGWVRLDSTPLPWIHSVRPHWLTPKQLTVPSSK